MKTTRSTRLFQKALSYIPGGVNSPVRAFRSVEGKPLFINRAKGCKLIDEDGQEYIDYVLSWGPMILGHGHPTVTRALKKAIDHGTSFGAPTSKEVELAQRITQAFPSIEMVRMVNSGTEATLSALRLARACTKRDKILKFEGCYHGHGDSLLVKAGSGAATYGIPDSPGVPESLAQLTLTAPFNDLKTVQRLFEQEGSSIAAVIVEPVAGNMGVIPPAEGFLEGLRNLTREWGSLLIFDEVMTGFRVAFGGAQSLYHIRPDLTCLGKIIGGGLPVGAYGGRREIMEYVAPSGPVYQAGTLSGNPIAVTAGIETLKQLALKRNYRTLETRSKQLDKGLREAAKKAAIPIQLNRVGSMLSVFFTKEPVIDYRTARRSDTKAFNCFFWAMLSQGIYLPPSQFEAFFLSLAHSERAIEKTVNAAQKAFQSLRE
ncbi:MAG TPA: glutamate-1-semialdehyde 2,1-aminomutase [Nitrospiria bacterium]|jgi:glutamate-1-semialdehyde 2,1-aminomutase